MNECRRMYYFNNQNEVVGDYSTRLRALEGDVIENNP